MENSLWQYYYGIHDHSDAKQLGSNVKIGLIFHAACKGGLPSYNGELRGLDGVLDLRRFIDPSIDPR